MNATRLRFALQFGLLTLGFLGVVGGSGNVLAQQITLDRYTPAERAKDGFAISRPNDQGHLKFGAQIHLEYANDPLVVEEISGDIDSESTAIVSDQLVGHAVLSLGLWERLVVFAGVPVTFLMDGEETTATFSASGFGLGDAYLGARVRLLGDEEDPFALGLQGSVFFPTADLADSGQSFAGEETFSGHVEALAEVRTRWFRLAFNAGVRLRDAATFLNVQIDHELTYGLGFAIPLVQKAEHELDLHLEAYGSSSFENIFGREESPIEAIGGFKYHHGTGFTAGVAAGPGFGRGLGSPDVRVIGMLGYTMPTEEEPEREVEPEPVPEDRDGDGLLDKDDQCPDDPEDKDDFEDEDGCPDPDNDKDGVLDVDDGAPLDPEDKDDFEDKDGVPDPDNDEDGILDVNDKCPLAAEDKDGFQDEDGCPDPDNDMDTVLDVDDKCPMTPGAPEDEGCPKTVRVDKESGQIMILKRVEFATAKAKILKRSYPILEDVKATLVANPQLTKIRVEGHTDSRGRDKSNMKLSRRRAKSVETWLIQNGVDASRLEAYGCGEGRPIDSNDTRDGRQTNRRVEFHIVSPAPPSGERSAEGCESAD